MKRYAVNSLFSLGENHSLLKIFCQFDQMQRRTLGGNSPLLVLLARHVPEILFSIEYTGFIAQYSG